MTQHPDLEREQAYVDRAYDCLDQTVDALIDTPLAESAADKHAARALKKRESGQLDALAAAEEGLCIGRVDPEGGGKFYVGRTGLSDEDGRIILVDFKAPRAAAFYQPAEHKVVRKRSFSLSGRLIEDIADLVFDPDAAIEDDADVSEVSDALLRDLERDRGAEMRDIAATIQASQYGIMSAPIEQSLIVQGGPGTGKTAIGLHRAAWLMHNHRDQLEREGVLVVGPNPTFMQYISRVMPTISGATVMQSSVDRLSLVRPKHRDSPRVRRLKGDRRMATVLRNAMTNRIARPTEDLTFVVDSRNYNLSKEAVSEALDTVLQSRMPYMDGRTRFRDRVLELAATAVQERRGSSATSSASETLNAVRRQAGFRNAMERIWPSLSQRQLVQETLAGPRRLAAAADGVLSEDEVELLLREPASVERAPWTRSDVPLLHEADFLVSGRIERFGHVILDEAQDLTPMEILMVGRKTSGSLTIFGDLAQATGSWQYNSWEELKAQLPNDRSVEIVTLELSYRVPSQILTLAAKLPETYLPDLPQPQAVREGDEDPRTIEASRGDLPLQACAEAADLEARGGSVGVIAPPSLLRSVLGAATSVGLSVTDVEREDGIGSGISILTPADAKGLEFDHAVVVAPAQIMLAEGTGPAELFVAMTRPTRTLTLIHDGALPDVLGGTVPVPGPRPPSVADVAAPPKPEEPISESASLPGSRFVEAVVVSRLIASERGKPSEEFAGALASAAASIRSGEPEDVVIEAMLLALDADLDSEPLLRALRK